MNGVKKKISIVDLRAEKGGDPDLYRRALSSIRPGPPPSPAAGPSSASPPSSTPPPPGPSSIVDEALSRDAERRSALGALESLRAKQSALQKTVIAPKKKAGEDVSAEVARLKELKAEIAKVSKEAKEAETRRDECLKKVNGWLADVDLEDANKSNVVGSAAADDGKSGAATGSDRNGAQKRPLPTQQSSALTAAASAFAPATAATKHTPTSPTKKSPLSSTTSPQSTASTASTTTASTSSASSSSPSSLPLLSPEQIKSIPPDRILNLNVGVLGHVDTGKTSLVKTLSSVLSTAALDKSKQSRARGITLDLGFSAFLLPLPEHLARADDAAGSRDGEPDGDSNSSEASNPQQETAPAASTELRSRYDLLQVTLVDCPGHASLIRTIIGGAQIIDMVLLVVDATKGMQTQTAECLVIAEMTTRNLIVVLNKVDLFPEGEREERLRACERRMRAALRGTKFEDARMVGISACVGGEKVAAVSAAGGGGAGAEGDGGGAASNPHEIAGTHNIHGLLDILQSQMRAPNRDSRPSPERFHFAVDHCFPIKGQGTVLTGTCLSGAARPNDMVEFPTLATQKKIKGLQMFRRKASLVQQGDRAGICVSNFDAKLMERGIVASPGTVKLIRGAIAVVRKVRFFRGALRSGAKFHVSVGHATVMATVTFWGAREIARQSEEGAKKDKEGGNGSNNNDASQSAFGKSSLGGSADLAGLPRLKFDWSQDFLHQDDYLDALPTEDGDGAGWNEPSAPETGRRKGGDAGAAALPPLHWARLEFLTPVYCPMDSLVIGSRLDAEANASACRLAFSGRLVERYDARSDHGRLRSYTRKERTGTVCRLGDPHRRADDGRIVRYEAFGADLFKKETNMSQFVGLLVETDKGEVGSIQSSFGTSGKFRVGFPGGTEAREGDPLHLRFRRYANDPKKAIHQDGIALPPARTGTRVDPPAKKKKKKAKNGGKNGKTDVAASSSQHNNAPKGAQRTNDKNTADAAAFGEIIKVKGDPLPNGKHAMAIVAGLFSMEDDISRHRGRRVTSVADPQEAGTVDGSFGKMGKCKVLFEGGISADAVGGRVRMAEREK